MMKSIRTALATVGLLAVPGALSAHEGHGVEATWASVVHWLSSPFHVALVVMLVAMVGAACWFGREALRKSASETPVLDPQS